MRIAVWYNLPSGGGKRALFNHVKSLIARGHTVEAWCPPTANREYAPLADLIPEHVVDLGRHPPCGRSAFAASLRKVEPVRSRIRSVEQHSRKCAAEIDGAKFDVVLATSCQLVVVPPLAKYLRTPSILYLQEPGRTRYEARPRQFWVRPVFPEQLTHVPQYVAKLSIDGARMRRHRIVGLHEWTTIRTFGTTVVNSAFSRESLLRAYGCDSRVCYLGIDTSFFRPLGRRREHSLVGVGEIRPHKNLELIVEAISLMSSPRPPLVWVANAYDVRYRDKIADLARRHRVTLDFRHEVDDSELRELLNVAAAMVYAPRLEPFGLAPLEAAACGLPVIGTAEGGIRESVVNGVTGILVEHDPGDMASAIQRLLGDPVLAAELAERGRRRVETDFSLDAAAARLESYLKRAMQGSTVMGSKRVRSQ